MWSVFGGRTKCICGIFQARAWSRHILYITSLPIRKYIPASNITIAPRRDSMHHPASIIGHVGITGPFLAARQAPCLHDDLQTSQLVHGCYPIDMPSACVACFLCSTQIPVRIHPGDRRCIQMAVLSLLKRHAFVE